MSAMTTHVSGPCSSVAGNFSPSSIEASEVPRRTDGDVRGGAGRRPSAADDDPAGGGAGSEPGQRVGNVVEVDDLGRSRAVQATGEQVLDRGLCLSVHPGHLGGSVAAEGHTDQ